MEIAPDLNQLLNVSVDNLVSLFLKELPRDIVSSADVIQRTFFQWILIHALETLEPNTPRLSIQVPQVGQGPREIVAFTLGDTFKCGYEFV